MIAASAQTDARNSTALDQLSITQTLDRFCPFGAPIGALIVDGKAALYQTCCNHWSCPVCWHKMAGKVRARIVHGARVLAEREIPLFFWTFTCRGRDLDMETADDDYYAWTNKALTNLRQKAKRQGQSWVYVQVTERQQRGAAHSHFIHTFAPDDAEVHQDSHGRFTLESEGFINAVVASGLGPQCQITVIETPEAVAHYISGYLEKHANSDVFPRSWRRVRWSRDWPDLPPFEAEYTAVLRDRQAWSKIDALGHTFLAESEIMYQYARLRMVHVSRNA